MVRLALAALLLAGPAGLQPVAAQPRAEQNAGLAWLVGSWRGSGTMFGNPGQARLTVRPALGGQFLEFGYEASRFEGRAFYRAGTDGGWRGTWFDNRGTSFPIVAVLAGRTLTSDWGSAGTERGRTVYRLAEDGRLHVTDSVRRPDGSYRDFASHVLSRTD